ncbi:MAG: ABC transporter permease [Candidatus Methanomethylicia archaeon]
MIKRLKSRGYLITVKRVNTFWSIYRSNRMGMVGLTILLFFIFIAIFADFISPYNPYKFSLNIYAPPSWEHILGTNDVGQDILSELIHGARISLTVGFLAALISTVIGGSIGIFSGYFGRIDSLLMRITDIFIVIPSFPLMILLAAYMGPSINTVIIVIGLLSWPYTARIIRSQVLSLKERVFVESAKVIGASDFYILKSYILPNIMPLLFANAILNVSGAIVSEAGLSFLGLSDVTYKSWGMILYFARIRGGFLKGAYWWFIPPGICITLVVLAFTLVGHALDEVLNPKLRRR